MTCGAANGYLCLSLGCEKRLEVILRFTFEIEKYNTLFSYLISLNSRSISIWLFVVMIFGTCVFILILLFMYKKCFHEMVKVCFG